MKILLLVIEIISFIIVGVCSILFLMWEIAPHDTDELLKKLHIPLTFNEVFMISIVFVIIAAVIVVYEQKHFKK